MRATIRTAGEVVLLNSQLGWVDRLVGEALNGAERSVGSTLAPTIEICVERSGRPFPTTGWRNQTRGAYAAGGEVVISDVCTSGFDLHVACTGELARFTYRWRPPLRTHLAARALPSRFHLLVRAAMLQYPALWWAGRHGVAPIHAPACEVGGTALLLVGPSGVGKTTLIARAVADGATAIGDNLAAGDGHTAWGVVEPLRVADSAAGRGSSGRRMPHGRREMPLANRVDGQVPERLVVLRRGVAGSGVRVQLIDSGEASRELVTSTYMAGELRRFWPFAALLSAATGIGPAHPPVEAVAASFADGLPTSVAELGSLDGVRLEEIAELAAAEDPVGVGARYSGGFGWTEL